MDMLQVELLHAFFVSLLSKFSGSSPSASSGIFELKEEAKTFLFLFFSKEDEKGGDI